MHWTNSSPQITKHKKEGRQLLWNIHFGMWPLLLAYKKRVLLPSRKEHIFHLSLFQQSAPDTLYPTPIVNRIMKIIILVALWGFSSCAVLQRDIQRGNKVLGGDNAHPLEPSKINLDSLDADSKDHQDTTKFVGRMDNNAEVTADMLRKDVQKTEAERRLRKNDQVAYQVRKRL
jgi:hypothetical protein